MVAVLAVVIALAAGSTVQAITPLPIPPPQSNSYGLEATKKQPPPSTAPTVSSPGNGASYSTSPITVSGVCTTDLLVQVYNNGVLAGAMICKGGSYSVQVSLFTGTNEITAIQYDELDQASPVSNTVTVTFNNGTAATAFSAQMTLTSNYGRRAANPGSSLVWPLILSGGTGPYAFSIDWGDGSAAELKSQSLSGIVNINHTYKQSGLYRVMVKVTDVNGQTAFLQLVAVANGTPKTETNASAADGNKTTVVNKVMWIPTVLIFALMLPTYWLGRRSMLISLRRKMEKDMEKYKEL